MPSYVAVRRLADETVILNLATGHYHGLDPTGSAFLAALERSARVSDAVDELAAAYQVDRERMRSDVRDFCVQLADRGLIELDDGERSDR